MLNKHRSKRDSLASRIRVSMFSVFGRDQLPRINTQATSNEISSWKKSNQVQACYHKLQTSTTYMKRIIEGVCGTDKDPLEIVFTKALVKSMLNPRVQQIKLNESFMKRKIEKYMVHPVKHYFFKKYT